MPGQQAWQRGDGLMTNATKTKRKPSEKVKLEKNYGEIACKGVLGAARLSRRQQDEPAEQGLRLADRQEAARLNGCRPAGARER